jgi:outer membrane protein
MLKSRRLVLLAASSASLFFGATASVHAETLADAIAMAYESNPTLQAQRATQRALDETYVQARTGWRPTIQIQGTATESERRIPGREAASACNILITTGCSPITVGSTSAVLSISQPLYTGGRVASAVSAAEADILAGRENLRRVENQVLQNVVTAYVDVRRDQAALRIREENVTVLSRQLDESRARFDVGEITRTDVAQSQARYSAAQAQLSQAQAQLAISRANYAAVVGRNPGDLAPEPSLATLLPSDVDQAFTAAEQNNARASARRARRASPAGGA